MLRDDAIIIHYQRAKGPTQQPTANTMPGDSMTEPNKRTRAFRLPVPHACLLEYVFLVRACGGGGGGAVHCVRLSENVISQPSDRHRARERERTTAQAAASFSVVCVFGCVRHRFNGRYMVARARARRVSSCLVFVSCVRCALCSGVRCVRAAVRSSCLLLEHRLCECKMSTIISLFPKGNRKTAMLCVWAMSRVQQHPTTTLFDHFNTDYIHVQAHFLSGRWFFHNAALALGVGVVLMVGSVGGLALAFCDMYTECAICRVAVVVNVRKAAACFAHSKDRGSKSFPPKCWENPYKICHNEYFKILGWVK